MRLSLLIPVDHEVVAPDGLLQEKRFIAEPVVIVVGSVISHLCDGFFVLSHHVPAITIRNAHDGWTLFADPRVDVSNFEREFPKALLAAREHTAKVTAWIKSEIAYQTTKDLSVIERIL